MSATATRQPAGLGTFAGVFTPSILTILGLILFRRLGFVVGGAGLVQMGLILALCTAIAILTSCSLSAIATNMRIKGGGDYYLISRSLGVEFGGALGIVLFGAQAISVAFYCIGLGEAVSGLVPPDLVPEAFSFVTTPTGIAISAVLFLFLFAYAGADWATRLQYVVMLALAVALGSFFWGGWEGFSQDTLQQNWLSGTDGAPKFWVLFALFFPAITGFTQGVSMSGDLKNPGKSLPSGTFAAIFVAVVVYAAAAVMMAGNRPAHELVADYDAMNSIAKVPQLVVVGIIAATLSSALASFMGAPRILQALAADRIFPLLRPFAKGFGASNNPRFGVALTLVIAVGVCLLGGVDVIAPVVSMFFLISYGLLNYATALEARANSPSFRPRFRWFSHRTSLLGAVACLAVMLMINAKASGLALALLFGLYHFVQRVAGPDRWTDSRRDHYFHSVRKYLLAMASEPVHPRNWRPHLLVFSDTQLRRAAVVRFATWLDGGAGITTVVRILEGDGAGMLAKCREEQKKLTDGLHDQGLEAFGLVVAAPNREWGAQTITQSWGLGPVHANTILLNWIDQGQDRSGLRNGNGNGHGSGNGNGTPRTGVFMSNLQSAVRLGVNVIVFDALDEDWDVVEQLRPDERRIDVWWSDDKSGRLMLLLAYLVTRSDDWVEAKIRLLVPVNKRAQQSALERMEDVLEEARVEASLELVPDPGPSKLVSLSRDASLVFMPLRMRSELAVDLFGQRIDPLLTALRAVALVSASEDIALDADPEKYGPARIAALKDELSDIELQHKKLEVVLAPARARSKEAKEKAAQVLAAVDAHKAEVNPAESKGNYLEKRSKETLQEAADAERELRKLQEAKAKLTARTEQIHAELFQLKSKTAGRGGSPSSGKGGKAKEARKAPRA